MDKTFIAKKIGEVIAFCSVGAETFEKGKEAFAKTFGEAHIEETIGKLKDYRDTLEASFEEEEMKATALTKSEATGGKLRAMRDMYVGDEWDNPAELCEWSGFFEGAAIVHWQLVAGAAEGMGNSSLKVIAEENIRLHQNFLNHASEALKKIGKGRAAA